MNKKGDKATFKGNKTSASVQCKQTCTIKVDVQGAELGEVAAGEITLTVLIGDDLYEKTQEWQPKGKNKLVTSSVP